MKIEERAIIQKFHKKFTSLPFSPRAVDFLAKEKVMDNINRFKKLRMIEGYNVFVEVGKGLVSQSEHTVVVRKDGAHVTTVIDNGL